MGPFRRRKTLNEQLQAEAEVDELRKQTPVKANIGSAPDEPSSVQSSTAAVSDVLGEVNVGVFGPGQDPWDAFVIAKAPGLDCDEVLFWALPDGDLLVAEKGTANVSVLANAVEKKLRRPYKALAGRQDKERWAVAARQIIVAQFTFDGGDSLELERSGDTVTFTVDGAPSDQRAPRELDAIADSEVGNFYVVAERIHGDLWDVRVD